MFLYVIFLGCFHTVLYFFNSIFLFKELLVYLAMFITTEPQLFKEMLRIRVGLITEVIASEMGRLLEGSKSLCFCLQSRFMFVL